MTAVRDIQHVQEQAQLQEREQGQRQEQAAQSAQSAEQAARSAQSARSLSFDEAHKRIEALARGSARHPALSNPFYELWMARELDADAVELVAKNFYERVRRTPARIALAFLNMTDIAARAETVENLYDEMGRGDPARVHSVILRGFLETLLGRMRGNAVDVGAAHGGTVDRSAVDRGTVDLDAVEAPLLDSTVRLIEQGERLFSSPEPQVVCGALLAQEWHAYPQLVYLYEGVRNYRRYFGLEEFHEQCEYFYLHIGATEKQHKVHSLSTAAKACRTVADIEGIERGFTAYLDLLAENWDEIYRRVSAI